MKVLPKLQWRKALRQVTCPQINSVIISIITHIIDYFLASILDVVIFTGECTLGMIKRSFSIKTLKRRFIPSFSNAYRYVIEKHGFFLLLSYSEKYTCIFHSRVNLGRRNGQFCYRWRNCKIRDRWSSY